MNLLLPESKFNPSIMQWARETAGLDINTAARKLQFADGVRRSGAERLELLESGDEEPSQSVLRRMAKAYLRPEVVFYLSEPPQEQDPLASFRGVPTNLSRRHTGLLRAYVREVRIRQEILRDVLEEEGVRADWVGSVDAEDQGAIVSRIRTLLAFDLSEYRRERDVQSGFRLLRRKAERAGAFVLLKENVGWRSDLTAEVFRGISLVDSITPFIVVNPADARNALSSTLLHELTHLMLGHSAFSSPSRETTLEALCDDVAGEILLPENEVLQWCHTLDEQPIGDPLVAKVGGLAKAWRVSGSMVTYRAWRLKCITRDQASYLFSRFKALWLNTLKERREKALERAKERGVDLVFSPHATRAYRLGRPLIDITTRLWREGVLTTTEAGKVLGVQPAGVHSFLEPWRRQKPQ